MTVTVTGTLTCTLDRLDDVRAALPEHIRLTRAEPGCMRFDVTEDGDKPGLFHVSEAFDDRAAFETHSARAKASDWGRVSAGLTRDFDIRDDG